MHKKIYEPIYEKVFNQQSHHTALSEVNRDKIHVLSYYKNK